MKLTKTEIFEGHFAHNPVVSSDCNEYLSGAIVFPTLGPGEVKSIKNIKICGCGLKDIKNYYCRVYLGDQTLADNVLLGEIPFWTEKHIFREIPYLAIKIKYFAKFSNVYNGKIVISAEIERENKTDEEVLREKTVLDIITLIQLLDLRDAGFVVVHQTPTPRMINCASRDWPEMESSSDHFHRMVAESINSQNEELKKRGQLELEDKK